MKDLVVNSALPLPPPPPPLSSISTAFVFDVKTIASVWTAVPMDTFRPLVLTPSACGKRSRAVADVDGDGANHMSKKRRLRLQLVTSRLSVPFAVPTTYINSRGAFVAARLAFQRRIGRSLLRRAAIENWMRIRRGLCPSLSVRQPGSAAADRLERVDGIPPVPAEQVLPSPLQRPRTRSSSPPGLSNYQALDLEDNPFDEDSWSSVDEDVEMDAQPRPQSRAQPALLQQHEEILTDTLGAAYRGSKTAWTAADAIQTDFYSSLLAEEDQQREVSLAMHSERPPLF